MGGGNGSERDIFERHMFVGTVEPSWAERARRGSTILSSFGCRPCSQAFYLFCRYCAK